MMNAYDIFLAIVTVGLAVYGFREGLVRGAVKLAGFIVTVIALAFFSDRIAGFAGIFDTIPRAVALPGVFIAFFVGSLIVVHILAELANRLVRITPIKFVDAGLGCAFGMAKAAVLCGIVALVLSMAPPRTFFYDLYRSSASAHTMRSIVCGIIPFVRRTLPLFQRNEPQQRNRTIDKYDGII